MKTQIVNLPGNRRIRQDEYVAFLREFEAAIRNERKPIPMENAIKANEARLNKICQRALNRKPVNVLDLPKIYKKAKDNAFYNDDILFVIVNEYVHSLTVKV